MIGKFQLAETGVVIYIHASRYEDYYKYAYSDVGIDYHSNKKHPELSRLVFTNCMPIHCPIKFNSIYEIKFHAQ